MKTFYSKSVALLVTGLILLSSGALAQSGYGLIVEESSLEITGTSTIHDWEATVEELDFNASFSGGFDSENLPATADFIQSLSLTVPVNSIESDRRAMNSKIYDALKERDHPTIRFQYSSGTIASSNTAEGTFTIDATGDLTIAGVTHSVTFPVQGSFDESGNLAFSGIYQLNMRDYDMDPPTAMLGTIRAGEEVEIVFNLVLNTN